MDYHRNIDGNLKLEVEKLLSDKFRIRIDILNSELVGGGCINNSSKITTNEGEFFLKWNSNCASDIFVREEESLIELQNATSEFLLIPKVFASKQVDITPGFLVQEFLPTGYTSIVDEEKLGRGLATIHQYTKAEFGFYHNNYCGATPQNNNWNKNWADFFVENRINFLLSLIKEERPLPKSEMKIYDQLLNRIPKLIPAKSTPALIHGDLWSGNYMITKNGPALIDPAAYYADREMEMAIMTMFGGFSEHFYSSYNEVYPLEPDWRQRNKLYQLYHVLNHYYLFGGGYRSNAMSIAKSYL